MGTSRSIEHRLSIGRLEHWLEHELMLTTL